MGPKSKPSFADNASENAAQHGAGTKFDIESDAYGIRSYGTIGTDLTGHVDVKPPFVAVDFPVLPTSNLPLVIARNLKAAMEAADGGRGISQAKLAKLSGVGQTTISLMLRPADRYNPTGNAGSSPTVERIAMLAHALNIQPWELLHPYPKRIRSAIAVYEQMQKDFAAMAGPNNHKSVSDL